MPAYCCVPFCNANRKSVKTSFHEFPVDMNLRNAWLRAIARKDFKPNDRSNSTVVCGQHFKGSDFVPNIKHRKCLKKGAVPTIFIKYPTRIIQQNARDLRIRNQKNFSVVKKQSKISAPLKNKVVNFVSTSSGTVLAPKIYENNEIHTEISSSIVSKSLIKIEAKVIDKSENEELEIVEFPSQLGKKVLCNQQTEINNSSNKKSIQSVVSTDLLLSEGNQSFIDHNISNNHKVLLKHFSKDATVRSQSGIEKCRNKETQTKINSTVLSNQLKKINSLKRRLSKRNKDNEFLRKELEKNSKKLESFEQNALHKNLDKMQVIYCEGLANKQIEFMLTQISNFEKKKPRWSDTVLRECVLLHASSPKGYDAFQDRKLLMLPCKRTLQRFTESLNNQDKISGENCELEATVVNENVDNLITSVIEHIPGKTI